MSVLGTRRGNGGYAVSMAHLVPQQYFTGTVHSVFATACNIAVDNMLITVQDTSKPHTPTSVRVAADGEGSWAPVTSVGDRAICRDGVLAFGNHILDLSWLPVWVPGQPMNWREPLAAQSRMRELAQMRQIHITHNPTPDLRALERDAWELGALMSAASAREADIAPAVLNLIGNGPGLTPSGDDILVGMMAALERGGEKSSPAFACLREAVVQHASRTTDISAHYLALAVHGHFGEPLSGLIDAVVGGSAADVAQERGSAVLSVGASSGGDALLGALVGLSAVLELRNRQNKNSTNTQTKEKVA